jgi:ribonuclease P protein component
MLNKTFRLTKPRVSYILKKGAKKPTRYYVFRYLPSNTNNSHFGVLISSRTLKKAVDRNRVRRQIYEMIRKSDTSINKKDVLIIVKPTINKENAEHILQQLIIELNKLNE